MNRGLRNASLVIGGLVALGVIVGLIDRRVNVEPPRLAVQPDRVIESLPNRKPKIYRLEASLEELRKIPALDGMKRADDYAYKILPPGVETAGKLVQAEDVLEGYAHPNGRRFFIIMKAGTRAYSVFLE